MYKHNYFYCSLCRKWYSDARSVIAKNGALRVFCPFHNRMMRTSAKNKKRRRKEKRPSLPSSSLAREVARAYLEVKGKPTTAQKITGAAITIRTLGALLLLSLVS